MRDKVPQRSSHVRVSAGSPDGPKDVKRALLPIFPQHLEKMEGYNSSTRSPCHLASGGPKAWGTHNKTFKKSLGFETYAVHL